MATGELKLYTPEVMAVSCPSCLARPLSRCLNKWGQWTSPHIKRRIDAKAHDRSGPEVGDDSGRAG